MQGKIYALNPVEKFYNDLPLEQAQSAAADLTYASLGIAVGKVSYEAWQDIPPVYIIAENDKTIPPHRQRWMIEKTRAKGAKWEVESCNSGHSPFLSMPEWTSKVIRKAAGEQVDRLD